MLAERTKGTEATMASRRTTTTGQTTGRLAQLWRLPLLLLSLGLFGYAAYLFFDPQPGLTVAQKIELARKYLDFERPKAAREQLNKILTSDQLSAADQGRVHIL